jgi:hypothetical protein
MGLIPYFRIDLLKNVYIPVQNGRMLFVKFPFQKCLCSKSEEARGSHSELPFGKCLDQKPEIRTREAASEFCGR